MTQNTRASQIAATVKRKLKELGQLPKAKLERPMQEIETVEQLAKRQSLKVKLKSFVG